MTGVDSELVHLIGITHTGDASMGLVKIPSDIFNDRRHTWTSVGLLIWMLATDQMGLDIDEAEIRRRLGSDTDATLQHLERLGYVDLDGEHIIVRDIPRGGTK